MAEVEPLFLPASEDEAEEMAATEQEAATEGFEEVAESGLEGNPQ